MGELGPCFKPIFEGCHQGPITNTGPVFNPVLGLRLGFTHLLFQTPSKTISKKNVPFAMEKESQSWVCQKHKLVSMYYISFVTSQVSSVVRQLADNHTGNEVNCFFYKPSSF